MRKGIRVKQRRRPERPRCYRCLNNTAVYDRNNVYLRESIFETKTDQIIYTEREDSELCTRFYFMCISPEMTSSAVTKDQSFPVVAPLYSS